MVVEWYCQVMGSEVGPLSQRQLVDMVRQHQINPEDLVRRNNSAWVPAFDVKGLFEAAAKPPTPPRSGASEEPSEVATSTPEPTAVASTAADERPARPAAESSPKGDAPTRTGLPSAEEGVSDWFCIASGEKKGPLGFEELKALAVEGSLRGKDRVWRASWPKFQKAAEVVGLNPTT